MSDKRFHTFDTDEAGESRLFGAVRRSGGTRPEVRSRSQGPFGMPPQQEEAGRLGGLPPEEVVWGRIGPPPRRRPPLWVIGVLVLLALVLAGGAALYLTDDEMRGPISLNPAASPAAPPAAPAQATPPAAQAPADADAPPPDSGASVEQNRVELERLRQENQRLQNSIRSLNLPPVNGQAGDQARSQGSPPPGSDADDPATLDQSMPVPVPRPTTQP